MQGGSPLNIQPNVSSVLLWMPVGVKGAADNWKAENLEAKVPFKMAPLNTADLNPAAAPVHFPLAVPNALMQHGHLLHLPCLTFI